MMTRPFPVRWLALVLLAGIAPNLIHAQTAVIAGQPAENVVGYQISGLGANQRVWQKVVQTTDAQGNTTYQTNQAYVELASGLNYWDAASRQWLESKEAIDAYAGGAVLKYATNASLNFYTGAQVNWQGAPYHPVILTAKLDGSVGETITHGSPSGDYANPRADWKNDLQTGGTGRESRKKPTRVMG
jgi:hypothetical protein